MSAPFPGMTPYLEHPEGGRVVRNKLIVAITDALTPKLLPRYQVDIEKRIYEIMGFNSLLVGRADVSGKQPAKQQAHQPWLRPLQSQPDRKKPPSPSQKKFAKPTYWLCKTLQDEWNDRILTANAIAINRRKHLIPSLSRCQTLNNQLGNIDPRDTACNALICHKNARPRRRFG